MPEQPESQLDRDSLPPCAVGMPPSILPWFAWMLALALVVLGIWLHLSDHNVSWFTWIHSTSVLPDFFWANVTLLGFGWAVLIVITAFDREHGRWAAASLIAVLLGGVLIAIAKRMAYHPRPAAVLEASSFSVIGEPIFQSGSMPSGHAAGAAALVTLLILALLERGQLTKFRATILVLLGMCVAWSRVAVGAHWPADVVVGVVLGFLASLGAYRLVNFGTRSQQSLSVTQLKHRMWWLCSLELGLASVCFGTDTGQPLAIVFQRFLGALALMSCLWRLRSVLGRFGA